jgi:hypothetical protein
MSWLNPKVGWYVSWLIDVTLIYCPCLSLALLSATSPTTRLTALTQPDRVLSKEVWDHALALDSERLDRLEMR